MLHFASYDRVQHFFGSVSCLLSAPLTSPAPQLTRPSWLEGIKDIYVPALDVATPILQSRLSSVCCSNRARCRCGHACTKLSTLPWSSLLRPIGYALRSQKSVQAWRTFKWMLDASSALSQSLAVLCLPRQLSVTSRCMR